MSTAQNLREERLKKLNTIRELGWDPYPSSFERKNTIAEARLMEGKPAKTAGRIMSLRTHGKIAFADLKDESGKIQIFFKQELLGEEMFEHLNLLDIGDIIGVEGQVGKTVAGEISIIPDTYTILTKTLSPLPNSWYGLKDVEERFRKRYLDLILNTEVKKRIEMRSKVIQSIRDFLSKDNFLEIETPTLQPIYGGGFAKPFVTHFNALSSDFYLRISDEMYLKRLIIGGYEKVFEITKVFRNEGYDSDHNPEFTMFEAQIAYQDYHYGMDIIEKIIEHAALTVHGKTEFEYQGTKMTVKRPWPRYSVTESIEKFTSVDPLTWKTLEEARVGAAKLIKKQEKYTELVKMNTIGEIIAFTFEECVEEKLVQPTIIYDYPVEISPLAKKCTDQRFTQRFEMFAFGSELGNNYTELNDPIDLKKRFIEEKKRESAGFDEAHQTDDDYIEAIEHGFPPTCGIAIGIDRLVMLLTNATNIKEVIAFPTLKPEKKVKPHISLPTLKKNAPLTIDSEVKKIFPSIQVGVAVIKNITIKKEDKKLQSLIVSVVEEIQNLDPETLKDSKEIMSYRKLYKEMGIDWHSRRPSPEALQRRLMQKKGLYTINTCVDAANVVVLNNKVSIGVFDLDKIQSPTHLRFGKKEDSILLLGNEAPTSIGEKELTYVDKAGPYNLDYNYRDTQRTAVSEETKNLLINVDGVFDIDRKLVEKTLHEVVELIREYCGGEVELIGIVDEVDSIKETASQVITPQSTEPYSITREQALALVKEKLSSPHLVKHSLAVEAAMKGLARHFGANESRWGMVGLLHDIDWDVTKDSPDKHTKQTIAWLQEMGNEDKELHTAILSHNHHHNGEGEPSTQMEWALYTCDELTGFIIARTLVLPTKKIADVTVESVLKKFPSKSFAAGVNRLQIQMCEEKLGIKLNDFVGIVLKSMQEIAADLTL